MAKEVPRLELRFDRNMVSAPVQLAAIASTDVIAASLTAFADGELGKPSMPNQFPQLQILGPALTGEQRRVMYENWLLAAGFHSLVRGVRESLEVAAVCSKLLTGHIRAPSSATLPEVLDSLRKPISRLSFTDLISSVNAMLVSPLHFEREFLSMQKVRNCLEHRSGIVRQEDLDEDGAALTLSFPRWKFFYMRGADEIEVKKDEPVNSGDGELEVDILGRLMPRSRTYQLGERINFTTSEFSEIAMACSYFGNDLASKLPVGQSTALTTASTPVPITDNAPSAPRSIRRSRRG